MPEVLYIYNLAVCNFKKKYPFVEHSLNIFCNGLVLFFTIKANRFSCSCSAAIITNGLLMDDTFFTKLNDENIDDNSFALLFKCGSISIVGIFVYWAKVGYLLKLKYASALSIQPV